MEYKTIAEIANDFGLELEGAAGLPGDRRSFRVYKGANQVFSGDEEAVRSFLVKYEKERPALFTERSYAAKE